MSLFQAPPCQEAPKSQVVTNQPSINANKTMPNLTMPNTKLSNNVTKGTSLLNENPSDFSTAPSFGSLKKLRHSTGGTDAATKVSTIEPSSIRCDNESSKMTSTSHNSQSNVPDSRKYSSKNEEVTISDLQTNLKAGLTVLPPERPPKPAHLKNSDSVDSNISKSQNYSHSRDNYANADEMQDLYISEQNNNINTEVHNPESSHRHEVISEAATHPKNSSQGEVYHAPAVSRDLKPNRRNINTRHRSQTIGGNMIAADMSSYASRMNDDPRFEGSLSNISETKTMSNFKTLGPPVPRSLKPHNLDSNEGRSRFNSVDLAALNHRNHINEENDNSRRNSVEEEQIYYYMPPVNTAGGLGGGVPPPLMIPAASFEHPSISYIDLDIRPSDTPDSR